MNPTNVNKSYLSPSEAEFDDLVIKLHDLARATQLQELRTIADRLNDIGREYKLCSLAEADAFAKKRNYDFHSISNT
jgi:hypothetical protein